MNLQNIEAKALAVRTANIAKARAAGKKFRVEIQVQTRTGQYVRTVVYYTTRGDLSYTTQLALKAGSKTLSCPITVEAI